MSFPPPTPGDLRHWSQVYVFNQTGTDGNGQPVGAPLLVAELYVKLEAISGRIAEIAHQQFETATHMLTCRYHPDIDRSCWFEVGGVRYDIGFLDVMGLEWIRATCEETWPSGQPQ